MTVATVGVMVVFTDLVGHTALSTSMAAADAERIRLAHFRLLRDAVDAHGGREVKNLGDGIMAAFPGVSAALDAATAMQQAIHQHNDIEASPLAIRIGVATGDCTEEGGDYFRRARDPGRTALCVVEGRPDPRHVGGRAARPARQL